MNYRIRVTEDKKLLPHKFVDAKMEMNLDETKDNFALLLVKVAMVLDGGRAVHTAALKMEMDRMGA